mgnify:CR=1 FL=1
MYAELLKGFASIDWIALIFFFASWGDCTGIAQTTGPV